MDQVVTAHKRMQADPINSDLLADCPNCGTCQPPYLCTSCEAVYGHAHDEVYGVELAPPHRPRGRQPRPHRGRGRA